MKGSRSMYFLFTDETNVQPSRKAQFFIYGGVAVESDQLSELHSLVSRARLRYGFRPSDPLKFSSNTRPDHFTRDAFTSAKREVLEGCRDLGLTFFASVTLHAIAKSKNQDQLVSMGANTVIGAFAEFLVSREATGVCVVDRLPEKKGFVFLRQKFETGLRFPTGTARKLDPILLYAASCIGASHAMSAIDIVLGSFRHCVNERALLDPGRNMLPVIVQMLWHENAKAGQDMRGLRLRPKTVRVPDYQTQYEDLLKHLSELL